MARGIQHATLVLLIVPWLFIGGTTYWYWSKFGRGPTEVPGPLDDDSEASPPDEPRS